MSRKNLEKDRERRIFMIRRTIIAILMVLGTGMSVQAAETVTFKGSSPAENGESLLLTGRLTRPKGNGPFPAVVLLHGCGGIRLYQDIWAERLAGWGYVALQVNSFEPRGASEICSDTFLLLDLVSKRGQDAHDAGSYLSGLPFVDNRRIAVMGWSHGGWVVLDMLADNKEKKARFQAAIALYPFCEASMENLNAPLLVLIGEQDDWCPAGRCSSRMPSGKTAYEVVLKIYPQAYHCFDWAGIDRIFSGHRLKYDPEATADAVVQVREFLAKYLMNN